MVGVEVLRGTVSGSGSGSGYGDGDGYGYGYGSGSGSGSGYGYGYGSGSGDGSGSGSGSGYGYGYGSGYGYGDGDGYGYGYGSGDGDGSGSGDGDGEYWRFVMTYALNHWTDDKRRRFWALIDAKVPLAFWRSDDHGQPSNGGKRITDAAAGVIHKVAGPLRLCASGTLHATLIPPKWHGSRVWVVALHGEVVGDDEKFGCLEREILGELLLGDARREQVTR